MYAIIIGWILELSEQRQVEFIGEVEASCGNLRQGRRLTSRNPFVTIFSLGCVLRASSVLTATGVIDIIHCVIAFKNTFGQLTAETNLFCHLGIYD